MHTATRSPIAAIVTVLTLLFLSLPLVIVVLFSFHESSSLAFPFTGFSFRWYEETLSSATFLDAMRNSFVVAVSVTACTFLLATLAAYGLSRLRIRWRGLLLLLFFVPITIPGLFIGVALLVWFDYLDVTLSLATITIAHIVFVFPYFLLLAYQGFDRLQPGLEAAAADLGAGPWATFRRVVFPQVSPVLLGATVLVFSLSFDEFIITFFVTGGGSTVPLFIWSSLRRTIDPTINTVSTLLLAITLGTWLVAFLVGYFIQRRRSAEPEVILT
jgi:ABC-type spermidine/putrescine transport system permease subunit II